MQSLGIQLLCLAKCIECLAVPVAIEICQAEQVVGLFVGRILTYDLLQPPYCRGELSLLIETAGEQEKRLRHRVDLYRFLEQLLGPRGIFLAGIHRPEAEVREKRVGVERHRPLQKVLCQVGLALLVMDYPRVDQALVMIGRLCQHSIEVGKRQLGLTFVEVGLTDEIGQLVVSLVQLVGRFQGSPGAVDIGRKKCVLCLLQIPFEHLSLLAPEQSCHPLLEI